MQDEKEKLTNPCKWALSGPWICQLIMSILDKKDATVMSQSNTFEVFYNLRA